MKGKNGIRLIIIYSVRAKSKIKPLLIKIKERDQINSQFYPLMVCRSLNNLTVKKF